MYFKIRGRRREPETGIMLHRGLELQIQSKCTNAPRVSCAHPTWLRGSTSLWTIFQTCRFHGQTACEPPWMTLRPYEVNFTRPRFLTAETPGFDTLNCQMINNLTGVFEIKFLKRQLFGCSRCTGASGSRSPSAFPRVHRKTSSEM